MGYGGGGGGGEGGGGGGGGVAEGEVGGGGGGGGLENKKIKMSQMARVGILFCFVLSFRTSL